MTKKRIAEYRRKIEEIGFPINTGGPFCRRHDEVALSYLQEMDEKTHDIKCGMAQHYIKKALEELKEERNQDETNRSIEENQRPTEES